jgi:hypothetical protein
VDVEVVPPEKDGGRGSRPSLKRRWTRKSSLPKKTVDVEADPEVKDERLGVAREICGLEVVDGIDAAAADFTKF